MLKMLSFSSVYFWLFNKKTDVYRYMNLSLGLQCVYFYANTLLSLKRNLYSFVYKLKSGLVTPLARLFLLSIVLTVLGYFVFPHKVKYCSFKVCKGLCWNFDEDYIKSVDCFW